jgi:hypothetical protein
MSCSSYSLHGSLRPQEAEFPLSALLQPEMVRRLHSIARPDRTGATVEIDQELETMSRKDAIVVPEYLV